MACRPAGVVVQGRSLAQSWVWNRERLSWSCCTSHLLQGGPDGQAGSFAVPQWTGLVWPAVSSALPCTAQMKVRDGVCRSFVRLTGSDVACDSLLTSAPRTKSVGKAFDPGRISLFLQAARGSTAMHHDYICMYLSREAGFHSWMALFYLSYDACTYYCVLQIADN
jgi:hypothetical protein